MSEQNSKQGYKDGLTGRPLRPPGRVSIPCICVDTRSSAEIKAEQNRYVKAYEIGQNERLIKEQKEKK